MTQQFTNPQTLSKRTAFIIFVKGSIAPVVLYLDDPHKVYENIQNIINSNNPPKIFEIEANGPIKKVTLITSEVSGCALQEEIQIGK